MRHENEMHNEYQIHMYNQSVGPHVIHVRIMQNYQWHSHGLGCEGVPPPPSALALEVRSLRECVESALGRAPKTFPKTLPERSLNAPRILPKCSLTAPWVTL